MPTSDQGDPMIRMLLGTIALFFIFTFPATWLLMLFLGNVGLSEVGYWGTLPMGILVSVLLGGSTNNVWVVSD